LVLFFLLTFVPSSLTIDGIPHTIRSISGLFTLDILSGVGIYFLISLFKNFKWKVFVTSMVSILFFANVIYYFNLYFNKYPAQSEIWFNYGVDKALYYTESVKNNYDNIYISFSFWEPFMFPLFYLKIDPIEYQNYKTMGKYKECRVKIEECYRPNENNLYITSPYELNQGELVYTFYCVRPLGTLKRQNPLATVDDVRSNLNNRIDYLKHVIPFDNFDYSIENLQKLFKEITGTELFLEISQWRGKYTGPIAVDSKLDDISRSSLKYRDIYAVETIIKGFKTYDRIFALMGGLHAYAQEPALKKYFES